MGAVSAASVRDRRVDDLLSRAMRNTPYFVAPGDLSKVVGVVFDDLEQVDICSRLVFVDAFGCELGQQMLASIDRERAAFEGRLPIVVVTDGYADIVWIALKCVAPVSPGGVS